MKKYSEIVKRLSEKAEKLPEAEFDLDYYYILPEAEPQPAREIYRRPFPIKKYAAAALSSVCALALVICVGRNAHFYDSLSSIFEGKRSKSSSTVQVADRSPYQNAVKPDTIMEMQKGISLEKYSGFLKNKNIVFGINRGVLFAYKNSACVAAYCYENGNLVQTPYQNFTDKFDYKGNCIQLNFDYTIRNGQIIPYCHKPSNPAVDVFSIPNRTDAVLLKINFSAKITSDTLVAVLYNIQDHTVQNVIDNLYDTTDSISISPDDDKIRFISKQGNSLANYYLDLNTMKTEIMGFNEIRMDSSLADCIGFISWIDDENVLYIDHYENDTCDLMRRNITTGETVTVINGMKFNYGKSKNYILFAKGQHCIINQDNSIWYYNVMTGVKQKIPALNQDYVFHNFTLSPDGKYVYFLCSPKDADNTLTILPELWIMNLDTLNVSSIDDEKICNKINGAENEYCLINNRMNWIANDAIYLCDPSAGDLYVYKIDDTLP